MSKRALPELSEFHAREGLDFEVTPSALQRWNPAIRAAAKDEKKSATEISIYGFIGDTWDGEGVTAKKIAATLRDIGDQNVVVNINSPGGSAFEGIAIYNMLRAHKGNVDVRVLGMAASAASIIAMAGDNIKMGDAAFIMIHNVLLLAIGNRNDLRAAADKMEPIDRALADLYAARTGKDSGDVAKMMDAETWFGSKDAIEHGFADEVMSESQISEDTDKGKSAARARAELQAALAKSGYSRSQQRELLKDFTAAMPGAGANGTHSMPGAAAEPITQPTNEDTSMDITKLRAEHPALVEQLLAEGHAAGRAEGLTAGAEAERARIMAVEAQALPGHEKLIASLKFDGKTSGPEAAVQILAAERAKAEARLTDLRADGQEPAKVPATEPAPALEKQPSADAPVEQRAKATWDTDAKLRDEFGGNYDAYLAYLKASEAGLARVKTSKAA